MSESTGGAGGSAIAERLRPAHVELRKDLEVSRHVFRGEVYYILRDPVTFGSHRFTAANYKVLCALRADRSLGEVFGGLVEGDVLAPEDEERFYQFVFSLHKLGFLKLPIADDGTLYKRYLAKRQARRMQAYKSILFKQVPLVNPDAFLTRTVRFVRPLFSRPAFAAWGSLVGLAIWILLRHWSEFTAPVRSIFEDGNLPVLWATLVVLKVAHEMGHAYACKSYGGHVPEMGAYFILFTPCAYVDASASWGFEKKSQRLFVCLAGMYVELAIAAMALIAWSVTPPGFLRSVLHNVVLLASVVTVGFNVNPLMRYDGYYALTDLVEIPNLRARASAYATDVLKRWTLGIRTAKATSWGMGLFLLGFGVASAVYKATLILGISMIIATKFFAAGLVLGGSYFLAEIVRILKKALPYLWYSEEVSHVRSRAVGLSLIMLVAVPAAVMGIPVRNHVPVWGLVAREKEEVVRAGADGFLRRIATRPGDIVEPDAVLAEVEDDQWKADRRAAEARLEVARLRHRMTAAEQGPASASIEARRVQQLEHEVDYWKSVQEKREVRCSGGGEVVEAVEQNAVGTFLRRGEVVATVVAGRAVVRALMTEEEIAAVQPQAGAAVEFRVGGDPGRRFSGWVRRVEPAGTRVLEPFFQEHLDLSLFEIDPRTGRTHRNLFEVEVELDLGEPVFEGLRYGMRGVLRFSGHREPLGRKLLRKAFLFADRLSG